MGSSSGELESDANMCLGVVAGCLEPKERVYL